MEDLTSPFRSESANAMLEQLSSEILSGRLAVGTKLLTEREFCKKFGISRGSVRRVLTELKNKGLVVQRVGQGTFVAAIGHPPAKTALDILQPLASPADLMEARLMVEPLFPALIVRNATASDFSRMRDCLEQGEAATTFEAFQHWDGELHKAFAKATNNAFFVCMLGFINAMRDQPDWEQLKLRSMSFERRALYEAQHREIVQALENRDAALARALLLTHLQLVNTNLFNH
ncbi:MAG: FCD domain-containing protein [Pigmentiphaga sp.]|nr:FCD domain-containing protein [Pigmentiphaga sp.]